MKLKEASLAAAFFLMAVLSVKGEPHSLETVVFSNRCGASNTAYGLIIESHPQAGSFDFYNRSLFCQYTFTATLPYDRVMLEFTHFDISVRHRDEINCSTAYMKIYDGLAGADILYDGCGTERPNNPVPANNYVILSMAGKTMTLEVSLDGNDTVMDFRGIFTAFRNNCQDSITDFQCETTKRCVSTEVTCVNNPGNISNCGEQDYSDQWKTAPLYCPEKPPDLLPLWIALGILGALLLYMIYWCCWRPGYVQWVCGCWRHKNCCDPCTWCSRGSRNCCRALCAGHRGCHCCGPRDVSDSKAGAGKGFNKMSGAGPSSQKGVFVGSYTSGGANGATYALTPTPR